MFAYDLAVSHLEVGHFVVCCTSRTQDVVRVFWVEATGETTPVT